MTWHTNDSNSLEKIYVLPCTAKWWKPRASEYAAIPPLKVNQYVRAPKLHTDRFLTALHMNKSIVHVTFFFWTKNKQIHFSLWQKLFSKSKKIIANLKFSRIQRYLHSRGVWKATTDFTFRTSFPSSQRKNPSLVCWTCSSEIPIQSHVVSWDGKRGSKTLGVEKRLECRFQLKAPSHI